MSNRLWPSIAIGFSIALLHGIALWGGGVGFEHWSLVLMRIPLVFRLLAAFLFIAAIGAAVAYVGIRGLVDAKSELGQVSEVGIRGLADTRTGLERISTQDAALLIRIKEAHIGLLTIRRFEKDILLNIGDEKNQRRYLERLDKVDQEQDRRLSVIEQAITGHPGFLDGKGKPVVEGLTVAHQAYMKVLREVLPQAISTNLTPQRANSLLDPHKNTIRNLEGKLDILLNSGQAAMEASVARITTAANASETAMQGTVLQATKATEGSQRRMQWVAAGGIGVALVLGLVLAISIARPIRTAAASLVSTTAALGSRATTLAREAKESSTRLTGVAASAEELSSSASAMAASAEEMTAGSTTVAASAEQLSGSANAVAAAVEEMTASIQEISQGATAAATVASKAKELAGNATTVMHTLGEAAAAIGKVTETITGIAAQTNLLALNATIEAARAGEAGRGFAVVAGEVKQLAQQAGTAAGDIAQRIATIQGKTAEATKALADISTIIEQLNQSSGQTAAAVQEQTATVSEIGRNISETSTAAKGIAQAISEVKTGIDEITRNTAQSATASRDVAGSLATLSQTMDSASSTSAEVEKAMTELAGIAERLQRLAGGRTTTPS
jgi:methyl-accepting chemotaxis protein